MPTKIDAQEAASTLKHLEARFGRTPSVKEVAEQCDVSTATAIFYLNEAVDKKMIVKRDGKFMSREVADAYRQKE